ncbi:MAG: histidine phosphatase family protein [Myxococcota bacterium]
MAIYLIRHGETAGNRNRVVQVPETPLSEQGLAQAAALGDRLRDAPIAEIWTSHLTRARQTAGAVEQTTGAPLAERPDLEERNFGALRGTPYSELEVDPFVPGYNPPEGEGWDDFHLRVARVWDEIVAHYQARYASASTPTHLAVVSHGLFLRALLEGVVLSDAQRAEFADGEGAVAMPNTALSVVTPLLDGDSFRGVEIERLACTAHLGDGPVLNTNSSLKQSAEGGGPA